MAGIERAIRKPKAIRGMYKPIYVAGALNKSYSISLPQSLVTYLKELSTTVSKARLSSERRQRGVSRAKTREFRRLNIAMR